MRGAGYARYSTDKQTDNSIEAQMRKIREYCAENDIELVATFEDDAQSGTNMERSGFLELLAAARRHEFEAVLIYDVSRGSRDVGDWFQFRKTMMLLNIKVISVTQKLGDITNSSDFLLELITVGMGQHEVLQTRQKSIDGVAVKAKQGVFLGGTPPLGYDIQNGEYVINEREAAAVRTIFSMYAAGKSYDQILTALHGAVGKMGRPLGKNSLHSVLNNERYIGIYTWNKRQVKLLRKWAGGKPNPKCVRIEGQIPAIIDNLTWERVQARMSDNKRRATNKAKRAYLLSGLIECEECGAAYVGHTTINSRGYESRYYTCGNKYRTHTCTAKNINANNIETFVVQQVKDYFLRTDFSEVAEVIAAQVNGASRDLTKERTELADINAKLQNGTKAILNGLDYPELRDEMDKLRLRKSELEDIIDRRQASNRPVNPKAIEQLFHESIENWNDDNLQAILRQHVTKIYAHADGSYSVNIGVHIHGCGGRI